MTVLCITVLHRTLSPLHICPALSPWQTVANNGCKRQTGALCQPTLAQVKCSLWEKINLPAHDNLVRRLSNDFFAGNRLSFSDCWVSYTEEVNVSFIFSVKKCRSKLQCGKLTRFLQEGYLFQDIALLALYHHLSKKS